VKRVLLTGARGFVGSNCLAPLLARGYEVHAVSRARNAIETQGPVDVPKDGAGIIWHEADLLDGQQVAALLAAVRPTHLLHLAWVVTPGAFWASPLNWPWVDASLKLLAAFGAVGGQRAVMVGSCSEYASSADPCVEGQTPLAPTTVYSACKAALSVMLPAFARQYGVASAAWARVFYLYGPGEQAERLVPTVIRTLLRDEAIPCSHGEQVRDFLYIEETADALAALLDSPVTGGVNIASGRPITLRAFLSTIGAQLGRERLLEFGARPARPDEPATLIADVTRLTREVGWTPRRSLEDGMARTITWWRREDGR
jgi:nucleoside-diphosphate-sugar epimerase